MRLRVFMIAMLLFTGHCAPALAQQESAASPGDSSGRSEARAAGAEQQPLSASAIVDSLMSESEFIEQHIDQFATSAYRERISALRSLQRRGYSEVLMELCARDGLGALAGYVRMILQVEYSMDHEPLFFRTAANELKALPMNWDFPEDPWSRR